MNDTLQHSYRKFQTSSRPHAHYKSFLQQCVLANSKTHNDDTEGPQEDSGKISTPMSFKNLSNDLFSFCPGFTLAAMIFWWGEQPTLLHAQRGASPASQCSVLPRPELKEGRYLKSGPQNIMLLVPPLAVQTRDVVLLSERGRWCHGAAI